MLGKAGINYKHHAVDGQGGLGDVGRHHHLLETGRTAGGEETNRRGGGGIRGPLAPLRPTPPKGWWMKEIEITDGVGVR